MTGTTGPTRSSTSCCISPTISANSQMLKSLLLSLSVLASSAMAATPQALFYLTREAKSVDSFVAHADQVDLIAPHWINVDSQGKLSGDPDPAVMAAAKRHNVPVIPLVTNQGFVREDIHALLTHPEYHAA